jgi:hypothetical protein
MDAEKVPDGHGWHTLSLRAVTTVEYVPFGQ